MLVGWFEVRDCLCGGETVNSWGLILESIQFPEWITESHRQQRNSCFSQIIVAQIKRLQMGGVEFQSRGQGSTAFSCDETTWQPEDVQAHTHRSVQFISNHGYQLYVKVIWSSVDDINRMKKQMFLSLKTQVKMLLTEVSIINKQIILFWATSDNELWPDGLQSAMWTFQSNAE